MFTSISLWSVRVCVLAHHRLIASPKALLLPNCFFNINRLFTSAMPKSITDWTTQRIDILVINGKHSELVTTIKLTI